MTLRKSPAVAAAALTAQSLSLNLISLFTTAFIVRRLGALEYGEWATASSLAAANLILTNFGLRTLFVRDLARYPDRASELLAQQLGLRLGLGVVASAVAMTVCLLLRYPPVVIACTGIGCVWILLSVIGATLGDVLQSMERFGAYSSISVAAGIAVTAASVAAVFLGSGPIGLTVAYLVAPAVSGALSWHEVRKDYRVAARCTWTNAKHLLRESRSLGASAVAGALRDRAVQLLVPHFVGLEGFGVFSAGAIVSDRLSLVPDAVATVFYPRVSRDAARRETSGSDPVVGMLTMGLAACTPVAIIGLYAAHTIAAILLPDHSQTAALVIQVTVLAVPLLALSLGMSYGVQAAGYHQRAAHAGILASIISMAVSFALVAGAGIPGASWSLVARPAIVVVTVLPAFLEAFPGTLRRLPALRILLASAALAAVCQTTVGRGVFGVIGFSAAGLAVYVAGLIGMRVFTAADVLQLLSRTREE